MKTEIQVSPVGSLVPPHDNELEKVLIGLMMNRADILEICITMIKEPDVFFNEIHKTVFIALQKMYNDNQLVDIVTLNNYLTKTKQLEKAGGTYFLTELSAAGCGITQTIETYVQVQTQSAIVNSAYDASNDVFDLINETQRKLEVIVENLVNQNSMQNGIELARDVHDKLEKMHSGTMKPVLSHIRSFDTITGGFYGGEFIIIAGRPGMGKTALSLTMIYNLCIKRNEPIALISLEMDNFQNIIRLIAMDSGLDIKDLRSGDYSDSDYPKIMDTLNSVHKSQLWIDNASSLNVFDLKAKVRLLKKKHGIKAVIIDYIQLMDGEGKKESNREREISNISRACKGLSKELDIPIIGLAQLNRGVETRADKRPVLSDLRESGSLEQDADTVLFVYRPEYYGMGVFPNTLPPVPAQGRAEIIQAKGRNTGTGHCYLAFVSERTMFTDIAYERDEPENLNIYNYKDDDKPF